MKAFFFTLIFVSTTMLTFAQQPEHLSFKGIPIDGTLKEYVSKMEKSGFSHLITEDGSALFQGDFAGYKDCYVGVNTYQQIDIVNKVVVFFPDRDTWSNLSGNYFNLKEMLTEKYGKPSDVVEEFDGYSKPRNDNSKMIAVLTDRCIYYSIWETNVGEIQLSIENISFQRSFVKLGYYDKINSEIIRAKALDDL